MRCATPEGLAVKADVRHAFANAETALAWRGPNRERWVSPDGPAAPAPEPAAGTSAAGAMEGVEAVVAWLESEAEATSVAAARSRNSAPASAGNEVRLARLMTHRTTLHALLAHAGALAAKNAPQKETMVLALKKICRRDAEVVDLRAESNRSLRS